MNYRYLWIDCEMTGLDPLKHRIIQIAAILTDQKCQNFILGPQLVIKCDQQHLNQMDQWCTSHHTESGLVKKCLESTITIEAAQNILLEFLIANGGKKGQLIIAGNSIHQDKLFLRLQMPKLDNFLHYRILDVSTLKLVMNFYRPNIFYKKNSSHRALDDIKESIGQYKCYVYNLFK